MENEKSTFVKAQTDMLSLVMRQVYLRMFLALLVTAITAYYVAVTPAVTQFIFGSQVVFWILIIAEFGLVIGLSAALHKMSTTTANVMFLLYAILNGATLSSIFFAYQLGSIAFTGGKCQSHHQCYQYNSDNPFFHKVPPFFVTIFTDFK